MKIKLFVFSQLICLSLIAQLSPKIKAVKVFSKGAEISRSDNVKINSGIDTLKITGLSPFLQSQTIQAKLNGAKILDIGFTINHLKNQKDEPRIVQLKSQVKIIEQDLLNLSDQLAYLELEYDLIVANKKISEREALDIDDVKDFVQYYKTKMPELIGKLTDTKEQIKKFQTVKSKLQKQINQLQKVKSKQTGEIEILYKSTQNRQSKLELTYHVYRCGWTPLYNMRASNIGEPIQFEYNAQVFQNTGVNWSNCKLTIATGSPILNGSKPELYPWRVFVQNSNGYDYYSNSDLGDNNIELEEVYIRANNSKQQSRKQKEVLRTENLTFSSFEIPQNFSLNTGAGEKSVNILKRELPASYQYYAVPKKSNGVFLLAQVTEWEKMPLIPGKSHIYFDETFVGKSYINPKTMNDTLDVSLGQDQSIYVEREKDEDKCMNNVNILGVTKTRGYSVSVKNNRNKAIKIQILDQVPVSKNNKIKVNYKLGEGWAIKEETGILEWNLEVPANNKKSTSFEFEIKHPKKFNVPL